MRVSDETMWHALRDKCFEVYPEELCNISSTDSEELLETWLNTEDGRCMMLEKLQEEETLPDMLIEIIRQKPNNQEAINSLIEYLFKTAKKSLVNSSTELVWADAQQEMYNAEHEPQW